MNKDEGEHQVGCVLWLSETRVWDGIDQMPFDIEIYDLICSVLYLLSFLILCCRLVNKQSHFSSRSAEI